MYEWVVGQDFHWNFLFKVSWFFGNRTHLGMVERFHLPASVCCQSCLGPLILMMSQVVQGTRLNKGSYRRFRGECVKDFLIIKLS